MNKRELYESIMRNIAKEVKKVLNENSLQSVLDMLKDKFINNGDGIYIVYYDYVSCDGYYIYIIQNGKCISNKHIPYYMLNDWREKTEPLCGGLVYEINLLLKDIDLLVFYANIAYYTYLNKWKYEKANIKKFNHDFLTNVIEIDCLDLI